MENDKVEAACNLQCAKKKLLDKIKGWKESKLSLSDKDKFALCKKNTSDVYYISYQEYRYVMEINITSINKIIDKEIRKLERRLEAINERIEAL